MIISHYSLVIRPYSIAVNVPQAWADVSKAKELFNYEANTSFKVGVAEFYDWWRAQ